jgi:hypothetical protein
MGIDPSNLTDKQRNLMSAADRRRLGRAGLTAEEAGDKYAMDQEREMHNRFSSYCGLHGILFEHENPSKRSTSRPGWPDFRLFAPSGRFMAVEFKCFPHKLSAEQQEIRAQLEARGFRYLIAYSLVEAIHAVQQHLLC